MVGLPIGQDLVLSQMSGACSFSRCREAGLSAQVFYLLLQPSERAGRWESQGVVVLGSGEGRVAGKASNGKQPQSQIKHLVLDCSLASKCR